MDNKLVYDKRVQELYKFCLMMWSTIYKISFYRDSGEWWRCLELGGKWSKREKRDGEEAQSKGRSRSRNGEIGLLAF